VRLLRENRGRSLPLLWSRWTRWTRDAHGGALAAHHAARYVEDEPRPVARTRLRAFRCGVRRDCTDRSTPGNREPRPRRRRADRRLFDPKRILRLRVALVLRSIDPGLPRRKLHHVRGGLVRGLSDLRLPPIADLHVHRRFLGDHYARVQSERVLRRSPSAARATRLIARAKRSLALSFVALASLFTTFGACSTKSSGDDVCPSRSGYFRCGGDICSRAIQACANGENCIWYADTSQSFSIPPECSSCPTCACLKSSSLSLSSCSDDGAGGITYSVYPGNIGDPCKAASDCLTSVCTNGVCSCLPTGSSCTRGASSCCGVGCEGTCIAYPGDPCLVGANDCYGGTCASEGGAWGNCTCFGPGAWCNVDGDCCGPTAQCVSGRCN
jgi:hypothetical protein